MTESDEHALHIEVEKALLHYNRQEYAAAKTAAITARSYSVDSELVLFIIAVSALKLGEFELARSASEDLLAVAPNQPDSHIVRAYYLKKAKNDFVNAEASLRTALSLDPTVPETYAELGIFLGQRGRIEEGITVAWKGNKIDVENRSTLTALQQLYRLNDEPEMAQKMGDRLLQVDPDHSSGHLERGLALLEEGKTDIAKANFLESLRLQPQSGNSMEVIAHEKVRTHPLFKNGFMLSFQPTILIPALLTPLVWWLLSLLLYPFVFIAWASVLALVVAYGYHGLFHLCKAIALRRIRNGRL